MPAGARPPEALNGEVILVAAMNDKSVAELDDQIEYAANVFGGIEKIVGLIVNRHPQTEGAGDPAGDYLQPTATRQQQSYINSAPKCQLPTEYPEAKTSARNCRC